METQEVVVDTIGRSIEAIIIGVGALPMELQRNLSNRHLGVSLVSLQQEVDPSLTPEFVFWFPRSPDDQISEFLQNFLTSLQPKFVIVGYDNMEIRELVTQSLGRDLDVRGVVVCDLYGSRVIESRLSSLWSALTESSVTLPENDHLIVAPLFIEDAAEAVSLVAFSSQTYGLTLVLAGTEEMTVLSFASRLRDGVVRLSGKTCAMSDSDKKIGEWADRHMIVTARDETHHVLSWTPSTDVAIGIHSFLLSTFGLSGSSAAKKKIESVSRVGPHLHPVRPDRAESQMSSALHSSSTSLETWRSDAWMKGAPQLPAPQPLLVLERTRNPAIAPPVHPSRRFHTRTVILGGALIVLVSIFAGGLWGIRSVAERSAVSTFSELSRVARQGDAVSSEQAYNRLVRNTKIASAIRRIRSFLLSVISLTPEDSLEQTDQLAAAGLVELSFARLLHAANDLAGVVTGDVDQNPSMSMSTVESQLTSLLTSVGSLSPFPDAWQRYASLRLDASLSRELIPVVKWFLGFEQKRTFLLVIQNASELRPTGGFLQGIGFLTFEKGKLLDISLADVESVDAQLTGAEQPPEPIRRLTGEDRWRVRDANWNPDGPQAASHIERVVFRATGRPVDGTIFLTSLGVRRILSAVGPVFSTEGDDFSAENVIERVTFDGEAPGGTQETTDPLLDAVRGVRGSLTSFNAPRYIRGVLDALTHQELLVTAHDANVANTLSIVGFDGAVAPSTCPIQFRAERCTSDAFSVIDANLGVNRADYFLQREREIRVELTPSEAPATTIALRYRNTATSAARPAGTYHGYTRILLPLDAVVTSFVEEKRDGAEEDVIVDHDVQYGRRVEGFYLHVPVNSETTIRISFQRRASFEMKDGVGGYNLLLQKQPGVEIAPTSVTVVHDSSIAPVVVSPAVYVQDQSLQFDLLGDRTANVAIEFASVL